MNRLLWVFLAVAGCASETLPLSSELLASGDYDCESTYREGAVVGDRCTGDEYEPGRVFWACAGTDEEAGCVYAATCEDYVLTHVHRACAEGPDRDPLVWDDCETAAIAGRTGDPCTESWACSHAKDATPMNADYCSRTASCVEGVLAVGEECWLVE
ncbi:MAG: hypothetical protein AAGE52_35430 [Myxococcota bacterium]